MATVVFIHLCVPRIPSTALTSRVALGRPAVMITDHVPAVRLPPVVTRVTSGIWPIFRDGN